MKLKTNTGKEVAPFTMLVNYKPEYQLPNKSTGEICHRWTYRSDLENKKYEAEKKYRLHHKLDILGMIYNRDSQKYNEVKLYNNTKPVGSQLLLHVVKEKIIFPVESNEQHKIISWLKSLT